MFLRGYLFKILIRNNAVKGAIQVDIFSGYKTNEYIGYMVWIGNFENKYEYY